MGFGVPLARWFRKDLKDYARDVLLDPRTRQRGIMRSERVADLLDVHLSGRRDRSSQLWSLICLELWFRTWVDR
jgi:asparagine synthase (glutamine-hydrolysing)